MHQAAAPSPAPEQKTGLLRELYLSHHRQVYRAAWRVTGNPADAEDVLQTVFLKLMRRDLSALDPAGTAAYLRLAAVNAALDLLRSRVVARSAGLREAGDEERPSDRPDPEATHQERELRDALRKSIATLPPAAGRIVALRFLEGYENREIARMLGLTRASVAVSLHRARRKIQSDLAPLRKGRGETGERP